MRRRVLNSIPYLPTRQSREANRQTKYFRSMIFFLVPTRTPVECFGSADKMFLVLAIVQVKEDRSVGYEPSKMFVLQF